MHVLNRRALAAGIAAVVIASSPPFSRSASASRGGYIPPAVWESMQAHPQWSKAERDAAVDPFAWLQQLFGGSRKQPSNRQPVLPEAGATRPR